MCEAMELLPAGQNGIGSTASRKKISDQAYVAYFRDTGLDVKTKKVPDPQSLDWVRAEIRKQDAKRAQVKAQLGTIRGTLAHKGNN